MHSYDVLMLAVLACGVMFGAWKGLAWQIASLTSIFASYFIAFQFRAPLAAMIDATPPWNMFLAMLILYLGSSLVIWLAFRFVSELINRVRLKEFDRHAGATLGLFRGVLWCVIITLFAVTLLGEDQQRKIIDSRSGYYLAVLLDRSHAIMPDEVHQIIGPYIHSLDERLEKGARYAHQHPDGTDGEHADEPGQEGLLSLPGMGAEAPPSSGWTNDASPANPQERTAERWLRQLPDLNLGGQN
jgi:membrane protein required for colicin V production